MTDKKNVCACLRGWLNITLPVPGGNETPATVWYSWYPGRGSFLSPASRGLDSAVSRNLGGRDWTPELQQRQPFLASGLLPGFDSALTTGMI